MWIVGAYFTTIVALGVSPKLDLKFVAVYSPSFPTAFLAAGIVIFAYSGHVAFFSFIPEPGDLSQLPKALFLLQVTDISKYVVVTIVIHQYAGIDVSNPALSSMSSVVMNVAYGIALHTVRISLYQSANYADHFKILLAGVIYRHIAVNYTYVGLFRGTKHMNFNTWLGVGLYVAISLTLWVIAWVIAESIPDFNTLLALISSLFPSWFTYESSSILWLYLNMDNAQRPGEI